MTSAESLGSRHAASCGQDAVNRGPRAAGRSTFSGMRNRRALAWAMGIMLLLAAIASTRHHLQMLSGSMDPEHLTWWHAISMEAPFWITWALAIPIVYLFVDLVAGRGWGWGPTLLAHGLFAAGALSFAGLIGNGTTALIAYAAVLGGVLAYYYAQRAVERDVELSAARLRALEGQLQPHFMFNALNSVAMLVRGGRGPEAVEMIARLSDLLRKALADDDRVEVTLGEEVALAERYLEIERVRFADRLAVQVTMSDEAKAALVPRLILQPIVENAVRHGVGERAAPGRVEITARTAQRDLIVTVRDDGPGPNGSSTSSGNGVGLKNTREQLKTAYGAAARFTLEHGPDQGTIATLVIPLRSEERRVGKECRSRWSPYH